MHYIVYSAIAGTAFTQSLAHSPLVEGSCLAKASAISGKAFRRLFPNGPAVCLPCHFLAMPAQGKALHRPRISAHMHAALNFLFQRRSGSVYTTPCRRRRRNHWSRLHFTAKACPLLSWPFHMMTDFTSTKLLLTIVPHVYTNCQQWQCQQCASSAYTAHT